MGVRVGVGMGLGVGVGVRTLPLPFPSDPTQPQPNPNPTPTHRSIPPQPTHASRPGPLSLRRVPRSPRALPLPHSLVLFPFLSLFHPLSEWREKRDKQLEAKDKASKEKNAAIEREAKQALEKFYQEYKTKKETQLKKNRYASPISSLVVFFSLCSYRH